jgi:hypothetical protein
MTTLDEKPINPEPTKIEITDPNKRPSIMIATPMYGGQCFGNYVAGLLGTLNKMRSVGVPVYWAQITNESLITRGRNELVRLFLEKGFDYLMFIDADISFDGNAVAQLMAADRDIVCGIYPKKEIDWRQVKKAAKEGKEDIENYGGAFVMNMVNGLDKVETDADRVLEVRHGGTGFMMIKRQVFEKLAPHVPTYRTSTNKDPDTGEYTKPLTSEFFATSIDETGALLSEDYHFCDLWRKHGGKIYANPFIKLEHVGTYVYNGDILKSGGNIR